MLRSFSRAENETRPITFQPGIAPNAAGSVLVCFGNTQVICAATIQEGVPRWMKEQNIPGGWVTAEYSMLPYSTLERKPREVSRGRPEGRTIEIQRLIGRSLRAVVDLDALGQRTLWLDCDVLQADGGTRTAAITGCCLAVAFASHKLQSEGKIATNLLRCLVAAVSIGIVNGRPLLDLDYNEDKDASVDLNLVMTERGQLVEIQAGGEEAVFSQSQLEEMLIIGTKAISQIFHLQRQVLGDLAPQPAPLQSTLA
ncbi:MAG: ribonuclease PH [Chthoniobacterales bacterium]|nr:ribonuclease PH [Chthoniobacterales bacterium]